MCVHDRCEVIANRVTVGQMNRSDAADGQERIEGELGDCLRIMVAIPSYSSMNASTVAVMKRLWQRSRHTLNPTGRTIKMSSSTWLSLR
jgi:hypothetical protein